ncbi:uncharacterized protein LOC135089487 isoform X4 [Scylla paramamosain]|uniref:uncharacterized protein LOC135089487 isoform X4 n=1 Tax=Scylla paramamosain TaxID=85552 RepID=UPI0030828E08
MAFIRSLAFFVWVFAQVLLVSAQWKDNVDCITFFNTSEVPISGINQIVTVDVDVEELVSVNEELYTLFWDTKNVEEPKIEDSNFTKYFTIDNAVGGLWKVSVKTNLEGLPDYNPIPQGKIDALFIFTKSSDGVGPETCRVTLTHNIIDDNNQRPVPDKINDTLTIEEGFMLNYPIYNFASVVQDKDGTSPNNEFIVMMDPNCPLEATKKSYISGEKAVDVFYQLKRSLDYETEPGPIVCDVTFQDPGTPSSGSTKGTITVIIRNVPDEPPKFSENYYYATVESIVATNTSLIIQPSSISAVDGDSGDITSSVTYTMTNAQGDVDGTTYFKINEVTGEVTLIKDLDTPFLVDHQQVMFFLKSEDASGANCSAVLTVNLPWKYIVCGGLHFEQAQYVAEIFYESIGKVVKVTAILSILNEELEYSLSDGYESKKYFNIDSKSGWITVNKGNPPPEGLHELEATAMVKSVHSEHTETKVNIYVMPVPIDQPSILNSLISHTVVEGEEEEDVANITVSQISGKVCITEAQPLEAHERFSVTRQDGRTWILRKTGSLDYEEMQEITMVVEAFEEDIKCPEVSEDISPTLQRSQVLVLINVEDKNDVAPLFDSESMVVAYPTNEALRRAVGPVVSVQAKDSDGPEVKYSITGKAADQFTVNENTGEVFVVKGLDCNPQCEFSVNASDTVNSNRLSVTVLPLGMDHIFTLHMDTTVSEVDEQLTELSQKVGAQISELYVNPAPPATMTWGRRHKREAGMTLEVQVYSLKNYSLMSLDELNSALEGATSPIQAEKFVDEPVFKPEPEDTTGLTAAVAVLGTLLGLVLIAGVGFFVYKKKKGKGSPKPRPPSPPISTLGKVYQNHSFEEDGHDTQRSLGHKTNNSLNGFTSVQVHSTQNGDSPPMHRSPLALPSDSIPLRNIDNQQQAGLRRTNPDAPDYFGSSSPAPPPSFTRTTGSSSPAPPPSTSSSFPIYAEIKKPKDPKPKSTSFPSSSSSSSRPEKNVPLTDFSSNSTEKKPDVPTADYEEVGSSKFSALKSSPPPRRSNRHKSDDDDDENVKEGLAYPGGKHDSQDEPGDEKKSVAFKVMVDTKEIEAENKGPAQRKAEAEMLMEANRKKLQEEDNEDEDQEETAKL